MDSFCKGMIELLINTDQYQAIMFRSFLLTGALASIHLRVV